MQGMASSVAGVGLEDRVAAASVLSSGSLQVWDKSIISLSCGFCGDEIIHDSCCVCFFGCKSPLNDCAGMKLQMVGTCFNR